MKSFYSYLFLIVLLFGFLSFHFLLRIEKFQNIPQNMPPYSPPPMSEGTSQEACTMCANSNPIDMLKEEIKKRYESILTQLKERDIKYDKLSKEVKENTTYISKLKMVEKDMNQQTT
jgi:hypothetical protein